MANTGNKQAVIAYKVRNTDGAPLDINGNPTSDSGLKQAIALLVGSTNPNPALYEVEFYFEKDAALTGNSTVLYDPAQCPSGFLAVTPARLVFDPDANVQDVTVQSSAAWIISDIDAALTGVFDFDPATGSQGTTIVSISTNDAAPIGQGWVTFKNTVTNDTFKIYLIHVLVKPWILETGFWNDLGFWYDDETWNF